jgi:hypothetical protein
VREHQQFSCSEGFRPARCGVSNTQRNDKWVRKGAEWQSADSDTGNGCCYLEVLQCGKKCGGWPDCSVTSSLLDKLLTWLKEVAVLSSLEAVSYTVPSPQPAPTGCCHCVISRLCLTLAHWAGIFLPVLNDCISATISISCSHLYGVKYSSVCWMVQIAVALVWAAVLPLSDLGGMQMQHTDLVMTSRQRLCTWNVRAPQRDHARNTTMAALVCWHCRAEDVQL